LPAQLKKGTACSHLPNSENTEKSTSFVKQIKREKIKSMSAQDVHTFSPSEIRGATAGALFTKQSGTICNRKKNSVLMPE
jgi:hypothetical protein